MKHLYEELWAGNYRDGKNRLTLHHDILAAYLKNLPLSEPTAIEWGCGTGRKFKVLEDIGIEIVGCNDIAPNAMDPELMERYNFECAPLHEASPRPARFSICTDVLEHVPEKDIRSSLLNIRNHTIGAVFITVDCANDSFEGHELHVTIRPITWWTEMFNDIFNGNRFTYIFPDRPTFGGLWTS